MTDKYIVVVQDSSHSLIKYVQERMNNGWVPIGGVSVGINFNEIVFAQAMIKKSEQE